MSQSEAARLRALAEYGVLDTAPEEAFDRLTALAGDLFDAPIALVSLVDRDRQWFKSRRGLEPASTPRSWAFCAHAMEQAGGSTLVVEDATLDPRFRDNPLVTGEPKIRFYAGAVLTGADGFNLGTLCIIDIKPRPAPPPAQLDRLRTLAAIVVDELELHRATRAAVEKQQRLERAEADMGAARRTAEEQAQRAALAEAAAGLGYWRLDLRTRETTWSAHMYRIYGLDPNTPLESEVLAAMAHPDNTPVTARIKSVIDTGLPADQAIARIIRPDSEIRHVASEMTAERDAEGVIVAVVGTIMDVTDQQRAKIALAESEERFRRMAVNASDIISEVSLDGVLTYVSPACVAITGYSQEELVGRSYQSMMHPDEASKARAMCEAIVAAKGTMTPWPVEFRAVHKSGRRLWLECKPTPALDPVTGRCVGLTDVVRDITARKRLESELKKARTKAEAAAKVKGEFLANMSHELRTPITSITGFTRLAAEQPDLTPQTRAYIERVDEASRALLYTVNDILDFSKLEAGQVSIQPQPVAVGALCRGTLDLLAPQARDKALRLGLEGEPAIAGLVLDVDPDRLRQVLLNLLGNAIKFTESGAVTLRAAYDQQHQRLGVEVIDTGPGIPAGKLGRLFKRFSQVDGSISRSHGGAGLGLAICKGLVETMGGAIGVESTHGEGSRFWFDIPATVAEAPPASDPREPELGLLQDLRVLIVDDHAANREIARLYLTSVGASVCEAADGQAAIEIAADRGFDAVLMDLRMPRLDGVSALRRIREQPGPNAATPILAFTADVDIGSAERMAELGFDGMIAKPMEPPTLIGAVLRAVTPDVQAPYQGGCGPSKAPVETQEITLGSRPPSEEFASE